ncbi:hypothetical protein BN59_02043 [Legionella massiliensis]|uniref:Lpg0393-like VPS9-like domain-containing protein n=1 Tax=Legionella massiliensis TaxID=1034943 RepID=A0A078L117_9GAMM|nr:hypothetical protein [Legionella massiliensis]CDZ77753.1 hypothetical protein BN59_02043 [Legionella massiliensis]CEE13491.1 hypothetical protein BN1094_02043 [Legionella massiliensis]
MKTAQYFIDALRRGDYFEAVKLAAFVKGKYFPNDDESGTDVLKPLVIYELCTADIEK